jgi:ABC-type lipoprotein export system ATPase subunit
MTDNPILLELQNVTKTFAPPSGEGAAVEVLRDLTLELKRGESVAIVGPSGSGKSTLLNIIGALDVPTRGAVRLDGRDLSQLSEKELAQVRNRQIGFIFQLHHLLPQCSILENVLIPTLTSPAELGGPETVRRAERLLERVGLKGRRGHRPGQLSGGERQRVAVVRALINQPKLLLADEPTGSLDRHSAEKLGELLVEINREEQVTLVTVTHSMELARLMGRAVELKDGKLVTFTEPALT